MSRPGHTNGLPAMSNGHPVPAVPSPQPLRTSTAPAVQMNNPPNANVQHIHPITMADISDEIDVTNSQIAMLRNHVQQLIRFGGAVETVLNHHGLNQIGPPINTTPSSRPYHVTSILVDGVAQSLQNLTNRVGHISSQVDHVIKRTNTIETRLGELAIFLDGLVFPALRDSARVLGPTIARDPTLEHQFAAPAARPNSSMAEVRQVVESIRVQQQGERIFTSPFVSYTDNQPSTDRLDSQPPLQSTDHNMPQSQTLPAPPTQSASSAGTTTPPQTERPTSEERPLTNGISTHPLLIADSTPSASPTKPMTTSNTESPFNPHAQDFIPAAVTPQRHSAQPSTADSSLPEIPSNEVAEAFSLAWAEAIRPLKLQTLAESQWASGRAPTALPSPAMPEDEGAQTFRQRMASRGIMLKDPREQAATPVGQGADTSAYASLGLFEKKFGGAGKEVADEETKKEKKGGLTANLDDLLKGYDVFKEKQSKRK
ncbi:MAG: hypothetical protein Q9208_005627 [Pyrenodesmia sp. 3 TL-2023]